MTNTPENSGDYTWLLSPPGADEVQLYLAVGDGYEMTAEVREAIDRLLATLQEEDVVGYRKCSPKCPELDDCSAFSCRPLNNCGDLCSSLAGIPCAVNVNCVITKNLFG
jgi:hypothetical protein